MSTAGFIALVIIIAIPCVGWQLETTRRKRLEAELDRFTHADKVIHLPTARESMKRHPSSQGRR